MPAPGTPPRSRSRTRTNSPHRARHVHPLSHFPQPQEVGVTAAWIGLSREMWNLRFTRSFFGLLVAAIVNMPLTMGTRITTRIAAITWIRRTTHDWDQNINVINSGTTFLRHHHQPYAQLLWLLQEAPRYTWHLRRYQREAVNTAAAAMTEYIMTFLYIQYNNNPNVPPNPRTLDASYFEVFTHLLINIGNAVQEQYRSAQVAITEAPERFPPRTEASMAYFVWLHNRNA